MTRSKVIMLPVKIRTKLDRRLVVSRFSRYDDHAKWLRRMGYRIGKSSLHRYGQRLGIRLSDALAPVYSTLSGKRFPANSRGRTGTLVIIVDPFSLRTRVYTSPVDTRLLNKRFEQALGAAARTR